MKPAERMTIPRQGMPEQTPEARRCNFNEVNRGLATEAARLEAERCLRCKKAKCIEGCPVGVNIPAFVTAVSEGDLNRAADILYAANVLPGITGRVCPQETQCEEVCVRAGKGSPVAVGYLERFVADWVRENRAGLVDAPPTGRKVAVVGAGPAGLTCAGELAKQGHDVTIFEALDTPGGVLVYGIPEFRLPKEIVEVEVGKLKQMGVKVECNVIIGTTYTIRELLGEGEFDSVFIANGAGLPVFQGIPGEHLKGVYSSNEYLTRINLMGGWQSGSETPVIRAAKAVVVGGRITSYRVLVSLAVIADARLVPDPEAITDRFNVEFARMLALARGDAGQAGDSAGHRPGTAETMVGPAEPALAGPEPVEPKSAQARCAALNRRFEPCKGRPLPGSMFCRVHQPRRPHAREPAATPPPALEPGERLQAEKDPTG